MGNIINNYKSTNFRRELRHNQTSAESLIWKHIRAKRFFGIKFKRQYGVGPYILDFFCYEKQLAIELDGGGHATQITYDNNRTMFLQKHNIIVLRFWNNDVINNIDGVLEVILNTIRER